MILLYTFTAFLSFSLFQASKSVAEEDGDIPILYSGSNLFKISAWYFLTGLLIPIVMLFVFETWYLAIVYMIVGIVLSMLVANQFTYKMHVVKSPPFYIPSRVDSRPAFIMSFISVVLLIINLV